MSIKKYKADKGYKDLANDKNFVALKSASSHLILLDGGEINWDSNNGTIPKKCLDNLIEIKE